MVRNPLLAVAHIVDISGSRLGNQSETQQTDQECFWPKVANETTSYRVSLRAEHACLRQLGLTCRYADTAQTPKRTGRTHLCPVTAVCCTPGSNSAHRGLSSAEVKRTAPVVGPPLLRLPFGDTTATPFKVLNKFFYHNDFNILKIVPQWDHPPSPFATPSPILRHHAHPVP